MPRLSSDTQDRAEQAQAWGHEPTGVLLDEGWYVASLREVQDIGGENGRWDWIFGDFRDYDPETQEPGRTRAGRGFWTTTDTPDSVGKLKATFEAFDATLDTNTDDLLGEDVLVYMVQQVAKQGKRKGEVVNSMAAIKMLPSSNGSEPRF